MKTKEFVEITFRQDLRSYTLIDWCEENIGRRGTCWELHFNSSASAFAVGVFEFARVEDASYFALKWT
jgi:hypothetical protein